MTAVDVDALEAHYGPKAREYGFFYIDRDDFAALIAAVRERDALREAVKGLADRWAKMADETPNAWDRVTIRSHADHLRSVLAAEDDA